MKVFCYPYNQEHFYQRPDTAVIIPDQDFYTPAFCTKLYMAPALCIKTNRLGRSIAPSFSSRYWEEFNPCLCLYAQNILEEALREGRPADEATAMDYSLPISRVFLNKEKLEKNEQLLMRINEASPQAITLPSEERIRNGICHLSSFVYLKMGDYIVFELCPAQPLNKGDRVRLYWGSESPCLDFLAAD